MKQTMRPVRNAAEGVPYRGEQVIKARLYLLTVRGNLLVQLRKRRRALPERLGLLDQRLLPLDPGLHLPRRQRIDVGRLPRLPPLGFDVPELLHGESMLAAEFGGLLLQGKLLGLKRRPTGPRDWLRGGADRTDRRPGGRFARKPLPDQMYPAHPCAAPQRHTECAEYFGEEVL